MTTVYVDDMARELAADDGRDWRAITPDERRSYYTAAYRLWDPETGGFRPRTPVQGDIFELLGVGA